jgi:hypothetical protein
MAKVGLWGTGGVVVVVAEDSVCADCHDGLAIKDWNNLMNSLLDFAALRTNAKHVQLRNCSVS